MKKRRHPNPMLEAIDLPAPRPKMQVSLRLDAHLVEWLRSTGPGWNRRVNELIRVAYSQSSSRSAA